MIDGSRRGAAGAEQQKQPEKNANYNEKQ